MYVCMYVQIVSGCGVVYVVYVCVWWFSATAPRPLCRTPSAAAARHPCAAARGPHSSLSRTPGTYIHTYIHTVHTFYNTYIYLGLVGIGEIIGVQLFKFLYIHMYIHSFIHILNFCLYLVEVGWHTYIHHIHTFICILNLCLNLVEVG